MANAPIPVTGDMNNKVPVNLKLQPRRHTDTLIFTSIYLMHLIIHFLCRKLEKIYSIRKVFFKFEIYLFSTGSTTTNKSDDGIPVARF